MAISIGNVALRFDFEQINFYGKSWNENRKQYVLKKNEFSFLFWQ